MLFFSFSKQPQAWRIFRAQWFVGNVVLPCHVWVLCRAMWVVIYLFSVVIQLPLVVVVPADTQYHIFFGNKFSSTTKQQQSFLFSSSCSGMGVWVLWMCKQCKRQRDESVRWSAHRCTQRWPLPAWSKWRWLPELRGHTGGVLCGHLWQHDRGYRGVYVCRGSGGKTYSDPLLKGMYHCNNIQNLHSLYHLTTRVPAAKVKIAILLDVLSDYISIFLLLLVNAELLFMCI